MTLKLTIYDGAYNTNGQDVALSGVIDIIKSGSFGVKEKVESIRSATSKEAADDIKKTLPAVTFSGTFKPGTRLISTITQYSNLVVIDIDKLDPSVIPSIKSALSKDHYIAILFVSPSGKGLKAIVRVNTTAEKHLHAFLHLEKYFLDTYGIKIDKSGKDLCRLCFLSHDPEILIREHSDVFEVDTKYGDIITPTQTTHEVVEASAATFNIDRIYKVCIQWVERNKSYVVGERNVYIHALACALNRVGISQDTTLKLITTNFTDMPQREIATTVRSAYFHNQHEHGSVKVKDVGSTDFVAPPYVANFTDDVAANDIMRITAMMFHHKISNGDIYDVVSKVANYYDKMGYIDLRRSSLIEMMNHAVAVLNNNIADNASKNKLEYMSAEDIGKHIIDNDILDGVIPTHIPIFDMNMRGGMQPANFYGLIGVGGTFKSIIAQFWAFMTACNDGPVLYLNGEMSMFQFYERMVLMAMSISLYVEIANKNINKGNIDEFISQMKQITKNNIFFVNGNGFNQKNIKATCDHIESTTGKKVRLIIVDGVTQMDNMGKEEIPAAIMNTGVCKEVAKETGAVIVGLMHVSGDQSNAKLRRDSGPVCRGGGKTIANMDGYFSTSLLLDPNAEPTENGDLTFIQQKVYIRLTDKRSPAGVVSAICNINPKNIHVEYEDTNPNNYEIKPRGR